MFAFLARAFDFEQVFDASDGIAQGAIGIVQLGAALQREFALCLGGVHEIVGMQLPAELQKFLFERRSFRSTACAASRRGRNSPVAGDLLELAAARTEVRALGALVAVPTDQVGFVAGIAVSFVDIRQI